MKNIEICREKRIILVNKEFYKASREYGSEECKELMSAQRDFPKFKLVVKTVKKNDPFKNIDTDFMRDYITAHDDDSKSIMTKFDILSGNAKDEDGKLGKVSFFELKEWFLNTFPDIKENVENVKMRSAKLLAEAKENARQHKNNRKCA
jgi:hypothetical protein